MSKVEVVQSEAFKIEPGKKYIITLPHSSLAQEEAVKVMDKLKEWGVSDCITLMLKDGDNVEVVEV